MDLLLLVNYSRADGVPNDSLKHRITMSLTMGMNDEAASVISCTLHYVMSRSIFPISILKLDQHIHMSVILWEVCMSQKQSNRGIDFLITLLLIE